MLHNVDSKDCSWKLTAFDDFGTMFTKANRNFFTFLNNKWLEESNEYSYKQSGIFIPGVIR